MSSIILQSARAEVLVMERFTLTSMLRVITTTCCMLATSSRPYTEHTHTHRQTDNMHTYTHTHTTHTCTRAHTHTHTVHSYTGKEDTWLHTYMYMYINEILLRCTVRTALASRDNMHTYKMCR